MSPIANIITAHGANVNFYADDTQVYFPVTDIPLAIEKVHHLLTDIKHWMSKNKLKLNESKTEIILIRGNLHTDITNSFTNLNFAGTTLNPASCVRNLGVHFDDSLSFINHINKVVSRCQFHLRNLYLIRPYVSQQAIIMLVNSMIMSHLDYCNSLLFCIPKKYIKKFQRILNRSARLVYHIPPREDATPALTLASDYSKN